MSIPPIRCPTCCYAGSGARLRRELSRTLTIEQLGGYILQHVIKHDQRILQLEKASGSTPAGLSTSDETTGTPGVSPLVIENR